MPPGSDPDPTSAAYVVRRAWRSAPLIAALERYEPRTTTALVSVLAFGVKPYLIKAWTVERDGELAGAFVLVRATFDRWLGYSLVVDAGAAPHVAAIADRSLAWSVTGSAEDVRPLIEHLSRYRGLSGLPWVVATYPVRVTDRPEHDPRVRPATRRDLRELSRLYAGYELAPDLTRWQLWIALWLFLRSFTIVVAEEDGAMVGAIMLGGPTRSWALGDGLTVDPAARSRGIGWTLVAQVQRLANEHRLGGTGAIAPTNPMNFADADLDGDWWVGAALRPPRRFRGQVRLRRLYRRLGQRPARIGDEYRNVDPARPRRPG
jgi:GNAT superfamily N-acetyltransferase